MTLDDAWTYINRVVRSFVASGRQLEVDVSRLDAVLGVLPGDPEISAMRATNRGLAEEFIDALNELVYLVERLEAYLGYDVRRDLGLTGLGVIPAAALLVVGAGLVTAVAVSIGYYMYRYQSYRENLLGLFTQGRIAEATLRAGVSSPGLFGEAITPLIFLLGAFAIFWFAKK